jgi:two-component sensor histidine kinase
MVDMPHYYSSLKSARVLLIEDVLESPITREIRALYCVPNGITAMMDIPIFMEGKLAGVMCYECTQGPRKWQDTEVQFALAINQVISLALETRKRRKIQMELMRVVKDKELLLKEMHHRIKNNLSILISLLRLQSEEANNAVVEQSLSEAQKRIFSMVKIHEQLYKTGKYLIVNLADYLDELVDEYRKSVADDHPIRFITSLIPFDTPTSAAINLGLITIELLNNAVKHAFGTRISENKIEINLREVADGHCLLISDNGHGFAPLTGDKSQSVGRTIVDDLVEQIDGKCTYHSGKDGTRVEVYF